MTTSKYIDTVATYQVIGCVFNSPELLEEEDKYVIKEYDFVEDFHKIVFGSIYNLYSANNTVTIDSIIDYLSVRPQYKAIFDLNKGIEYLQNVSEIANKDTFNYYYNRLKKMTLFRAYENIGMDISFLYDPSLVLETDLKQKQEEWLDNTSLSDIADIINNKIEEIKATYVEDDIGAEYQAGDGLISLIEGYEKVPDVGIPLYGSLINTITRGARLKKFYLRSAPTGIGKSRTMIADICNFSCKEIYNPDFEMWINNGYPSPSLYITTEQEKSEVQTMMLAFLSAVNEEHILNGKYEDGERERVIKAAQILKEAPLWIEELPDFSLQDVENKIKKHIREHDVKYVAHDYIHTSLKILEEITRRTGGVKLREDNILFMLSTRLKDICNKYGIFIISATQLSGDFKTSDSPDQNLLRGAKAIADKIDTGMILLLPTKEDLEKIQPVLAANPHFKVPNMKMSIYKNRGGGYKGVYLWCYADLGICRVNPMFCTTWNHELVNMKNIQIIVDEPVEF